MDQKKILIKTVLDLFEAEGSGFTMDQVAKKMKISKKTIYKEYGNKEDLLMLIVEAIFKGIEDKLLAIGENTEYNSLEKLVKVTCAFPDVKDIDYHKAIMMKSDFTRPYERFIHYIEDNWSFTHELFDKCIEEGYLQKFDFQVFRLIILGITKQVLDSDFPNPEVMLETCIKQTFKGFAP